MVNFNSCYEVLQDDFNIGLVIYSSELKESKNT